MSEFQKNSNPTLTTTNQMWKYIKFLCLWIAVSMNYLFLWIVVSMNCRVYEMSCLWIAVPYIDCRTLSMSCRIFSLTCLWVVVSLNWRIYELYRRQFILNNRILWRTFHSSLYLIWLIWIHIYLNKKYSIWNMIIFLVKS